MTVVERKTRLVLNGDCVKLSLSIAGSLIPEMFAISRAACFKSDAGSQPHFCWADGSTQASSKTPHRSDLLFQPNKLWLKKVPLFGVKSRNFPIYKPPIDLCPNIRSNQEPSLHLTPQIVGKASELDKHINWSCLYWFCPKAEPKE